MAYAASFDKGKTRTSVGYRPQENMAGTFNLIIDMDTFLAETKAPGYLMLMSNHPLVEQEGSYRIFLGFERRDQSFDLIGHWFLDHQQDTQRDWKAWLWRTRREFAYKEVFSI